MEIADEDHSICFVFIIIFKNVVYYKLRDKIVVQSLVINIGICFASSYNVFRADLKLLYRFFESVARETIYCTFFPTVWCVCLRDY